MKVAVVKESAPGERRVALVPEMIARLRGAGLEILVESGAGDGAWLADSAYAEAGATVVSRAELLADADLIVMVGKPDRELAGALRPGQAILGLLGPLADPGLAAALAARGDRDQPGPAAPDADPGAVDGRADLAGQRGRVQGRPGRGRRRIGRFFPMLMTAAGTAAGPGTRPRDRGGPACRRSAPPAASAPGDRLRRPAADPRRGGIARRARFLD